MPSTPGAASRLIALDWMMEAYRLTRKEVKRRSQHLGVDMVQERGEPLLLPSPRGDPYAFQRL
jgi:hypothetical protein